MKLPPYDVLKPGMCFGETTDTHFSNLIRILTCGLLKRRDLSISTHIVCIAESHGLKYGIEMTPPKIRRVDLNTYFSGKSKLTFVGDYPYPITDEQRGKCNEWLWETHAKGVMYGTKELLKWVGFKTDNPETIVCSELYQMMLVAVGLKIPRYWKTKVDPYDVQEFCKKVVV